ncbi:MULTISPECIES: hypothetical protein [Thalassospira]|jgi:hypothetical protein|uniref:DUF2336 domain-containing protein n=1 Tax=Thalassospira povalilytica TaxID=732237 RepID=A0ABX4RA39_9PROT|nr:MULTISPECIES: hypothetical protein [Thalassospira]MEE3044938.1 hypothetical protein [Pseudomonadota bacterium]RCK27291.1 hypothetical protein TH8_05050 [Thalassospira profundimaris]KZB60228.1 hypothetical protein AUQ42_05705 [Thalassospira sp. MCCC 1A02491]MAL41504.1 hypothetical protein [Thalassospira sp.]MCC4241604.1 hypothetical protein [Thalassospira povalilytica]
MSSNHGISYDALKYALTIKESYQSGEPLTVTGAAKQQRLLMPEHLLSNDLALMQYDDPLALAVIATRDPESPMALAAAIRMGPHAKCKELITGVFEVVSDATKHELVADCAKLLTKNAFSPEAFHLVRTRASNHVVEIREAYRRAMADNLRALLDGKMAAREFVEEFIELASNGNLRIDIYRRLVMKLMRSDAVRPSVKFMLLERLDRFPQMVKLQIVNEVNSAPDTPEYQTLKQELRWIYETKQKQQTPQPINASKPQPSAADLVARSQIDFGAAAGMHQRNSIIKPAEPTLRRNANPSIMRSGGFSTRELSSWLN